jgi:hypothetical protein
MLGLARSGRISAVEDVHRPAERRRTAAQLALLSACETLVASEMVGQVSLWLPGLSGGYVVETAAEYGLQVEVAERVDGCTAHIRRLDAEREDA